MIVVDGDDIYVRKHHPHYGDDGTITMRLGATERVGSIGHYADGLRIAIYCHTYPRTFARDDHASAQDYALELMS